MIKELRKKDRPHIIKLIEDRHIFNDEERAVAAEVIDEALAKGEKSGYFVSCIFSESKELAGFICFGPIPMTDSRYDLYWIAVDVRHSQRGFAIELMNHMERIVRLKKGNRIYIETSSTESYHPARNLYTLLGYRIVSRLKDFYRDGDDKLVYMKEIHLNANEPYF